MEEQTINEKRRWKHISFFKGWTVFEKLLLTVNIFIALVFLVYSCALPGGYKDWRTWVAFFANAFNIISVLLATKKKVSCFLWGILAVAGFGAVSLGNQVTGNVILYWAFYIPAQIGAFFLWRRSAKDKMTVEPVDMNIWICLITVMVAIGLIAIFSWAEQQNNFNWFWYHSHDLPSVPQSVMDSSVLMLSLVMTLFTWLRYRERWIVSILVDTLQIALWCIMIDKSVRNGENYVSACIMLVSSLTMLVSAVYGVINWRKKANQ